MHINFTNVKHKHNPKVSPLGIALIKKWQTKLGDAGMLGIIYHSISNHQLMQISTFKKAVKKQFIHLEVP